MAPIGGAWPATSKYLTTKHNYENNYPLVMTNITIENDHL